MNKIYIILPTLLLTLCSCGKNPNLGKKIKVEDFFNQSESIYGVYFYSESCLNCADTQPYIDEYLTKDLNKEKYVLKNIYFLDRQENNIEKFIVYDENATPDMFRNYITGISNIKDIQQMGYPTLYVVNNKAIETAYVGTKEITTYIKSIW